MYIVILIPTTEEMLSLINKKGVSVPLLILVIFLFAEGEGFEPKREEFFGKGVVVAVYCSWKNTIREEVYIICT